MEKEMSLPSLEPMIGRVVRVYKGGPESRVGRLLAVNDDHLVLQTEKDGVLYYFLRHIKSVAEDTKEISDQGLDEEVEFPNDNNMEELLGGLIGKHIRIDRAGPESRSGRLLAVTYDHLTLETKEEGVLYVLLNHIKSINIEESAEQGDGQDAGQGEEEREVPFFDEDGVDELLDALKYRWIKINRGGAESIEGVLVDSSGDHLVLVVQQEVLRIPLFHIRNISVASKKVEEKKEEEQQEQHNSNESKLSSDDISYIEKMLSEKYKSRGSNRSSSSSSKSSSSRSSHRSSSRNSHRTSSRSHRTSSRSHRSSSRSHRSSSRSHRSSSRSHRSSSRSHRSSSRSSHRSSSRNSHRRSNRRRSNRRSNRREKKRGSNRRVNKRSNKKRRARKRKSNRLTFFTR